MPSPGTPPSLRPSLRPSVPAGAAALTGAGRVLSDEPPRQEPHRQRCGREPEPRLAGPRLPLRQTRGIPCLFSPLPDLPAPLPPSTATFTSVIPPPRRPRRLPAFKAPRATPPRIPHPSSRLLPAPRPPAPREVQLLRSLFSSREAPSSSSSSPRVPQCRPPPRKLPAGRLPAAAPGGLADPSPPPPPLGALRN